MAMTPEDGLEAAEASPLPSGPALLRSALLVRGQRIVGILTSFVIGQGMAQGLTLLAGLFLVRHLSVQAYAQFGLASGFQTMFLTLMDLGFAGTIVPLVGPNRDDAALVGRYVRAAKHLRDRSFFLLAPVAAVAFLSITHRQHWSLPLQLGLLMSTLAALYYGGKASYISAPLILHGRLRSYYILQVAIAAARLGSYLLLWLAGGLNAWIAVAISAILIWVSAEWYSRRALPLVVWPPEQDRRVEKQVLHYILPAAPAMIFAAFQAQLTLFLISIFGGQTMYIAQVAALGRIGQVFTVLTTFNLMVIEPFVARLNHRKLFPTYVTLTGLACVVLAPVVYAAFLWPQAFLLLIGPKYSNLRDLLGWVILGATVNYIATLLWMMNRARKWVFWSGSIVEVGLLVAVQIAFIVRVGIRNTRDAVFLTVAASFCMLAAHLYVAVVGFWRDHSTNSRESAPLPAAP